MSPFSAEVVVLAASHFFLFHFVINYCPFAGLPFTRLPFSRAKASKVQLLPGARALPKCECCSKKQKHGAGPGACLLQPQGAALFSAHHWQKVPQKLHMTNPFCRKCCPFSGHYLFSRHCLFTRHVVAIALHFLFCFSTFFNAKAASKSLPLQLSRLSLFPFLGFFF